MLQNLVIGVGPPGVDGEVGSSAIMIPGEVGPFVVQDSSFNLDKSE
jgi:hypothetical protein